MTGVVGLLAGALVMVPGASTAVPAVPAAQAGSIEVWGTAIDGSPANTAHSAAQGPWTATALGSGADFGITSAGALRRLPGTNDGVSTLDVPADLAAAQVKAVSTYGTVAAAVKADGSVQLWGAARALPLGPISVATLGAKAVDVSVRTTILAILLEDGRVRILTNNGLESLKDDGGADITTAAEVQATGDLAFARLQGGGLVGYSSSGDQFSFPAAVSGDDLPDPLVSFAAGAGRLVAATEAGTVYTFGTNGEPLPGEEAFPADAVDGKVIDVAATDTYFAVLTDDDEVAVWGATSDAADYATMTTVPASVDGHDVADLVGSNRRFGAVVSAPPVAPVSQTAAPVIAGTPQVGATLTGTPATFAGSPETVTNQWLADGVAIANATGTTFTLTAAQLGKNITFQSTATRGDSTVPSSLSPAVGPVVVAAPVAATTTTTVSSPASTYGTPGTATVAVANAAGGTVTLSGAGAPQTAAVVGGRATFGLAGTLAAGNYTLTAAYSGAANVKPSAGTSTYSVAKAKSKRPAFKANKASTSKKKGKATVTVSTNGGQALAGGKVQITLKNGKSTKKITATLSNGKRSISLPKLKKGTWKITVSYKGDANYVAQNSKSYKLKIKK